MVDHLKGGVTTSLKLLQHYGQDRQMVDSFEVIWRRLSPQKAATLTLKLSHTNTTNKQDKFTLVILRIVRDRNKAFIIIIINT